MAASCRPCVARQAEGFRWRRHTRSSLFCATLVTRGGATHPHTGRGGGGRGDLDSLVGRWPSPKRKREKKTAIRRNSARRR